MDKLMQVVRHRGYVSEKAVEDALAPVFGMTPRSVKFRLEKGQLTKEECEVIGSYFEMTMKEYYDTFMSGLFVEDAEGHFVCHVDNPYLHMHPKNPTPEKKRRWMSPERRKQKLLEDIDKL